MKQNPLKPHVSLFKRHKIASSDLLGFFSLTGGVRDPQNPGATATDPQIISMCNAATQRKPQQKTCLYWTRVARTIDVTFFVLYIITIIVFLSVLGKLWIP